MTKTKNAQTRQAKARKAGTSSDGPLSLRQVVDELGRYFFDERDVPAEHHCTTDGPAACTHEARARRPLLTRLEEIVAPGTGSAREPGSRSAGGVTRGSPAPWSTGPAHLIDEIHRAAVRFDAALRDALDLGPLPVERGVILWRRIGPRCAVADVYDLDPPADRTCVHASCQPNRQRKTTLAADTPAWIAGPAALRGLPLLVELLQERDATHDLVAGPLLNPARPERGRSWGTVERTVRLWHLRAKRLTGHEERPVVIRQRLNPFAGQHWVGPTCEAPWSCGHLSCRLVHLAPRPQWEAAYCPFCNTSGFTWDPLWGVLRCGHPPCRDEDGQRPAWSADAFMAPITQLVDEMRKAGLT